MSLRRSYARQFSKHRKFDGLRELCSLIKFGIIIIIITLSSHLTIHKRRTGFNPVEVVKQWENYEGNIKPFFRNFHMQTKPFLAQPPSDEWCAIAKHRVDQSCTFMYIHPTHIRSTCPARGRTWKYSTKRRGGNSSREQYNTWFDWLNHFTYL